MSELIDTLYNNHYEAPDLVSEQDLLRSLSPERLLGFINHCGEKLAEMQRLEQLACDMYQEKFGEL